MTYDALPHRFAGRTAIADLRAAHESLEAGARVGRELSPGRSRDGAARAGQARVPRSRRPLGPAAAAGRGRRARRGAVRARSPASRSATSSASRARPSRTRRGELSLRLTGFELLAPNRQPLPDTWPRPVRRRGALPPALPRPAGERPRARELFAVRARVISAFRRFLDDARLPRGRDAGAAAALRRRAGAAVHDAPQRARPRPLPAHRHRAVPEAAHRRRARAGLRDRQGLPQRGRLVQAQPRVHDARDVRGVRRLRGRHAHDRGDGCLRRPGGARHHRGGVEGRDDRPEAALAPAAPRRRAHRAPRLRSVRRPAGRAGTARPRSTRRASRRAPTRPGRSWSTTRCRTSSSRT